MVFLFIFGCTVKEQVHADKDSFIKDPASYIDKDLVITAVLEDVVSRYSLYRGKKIEIIAPFSYFGTRSFWPWYVLLQEDEKTLRCYTRHYRIKVSDDALHLLRLARHKKEPVTVLGVLNKDGIDIEKISYDGMSVRPDIDLPSVFTVGLSILTDDNYNKKSLPNEEAFLQLKLFFYSC